MSQADRRIVLDAMLDTAPNKYPITAIDRIEAYIEGVRKEVRQECADIVRDTPHRGDAYTLISKGGPDWSTPPDSTE